MARITFIAIFFMNLQKLSWAFTSLIASGVCIGGDPAHAINLVTNGSFEADAISDNSFARLSSLTGWTVHPNPVDVIRDPFRGWTSQNGSQFVEMDSFANTQISQTISSLSIGQAYNFSFYYSPRADFATETSLPASTLGLNVSLGATQIFALAQQGGPSMNWQKYNYQFTATSTSQTIFFVGAGTSDGYGAFLDNVSVEAVPAPLPILGSGAALGYFRRMRGQSRRLRQALSSQGQG
jgi:hypothetical protein